MSLPRAFDPNRSPWNFFHVPAGSPVNDCAIFVVHGMGEQQRLETAAALRAGFEDALEALQPASAATAPSLAAPHIEDGYWADYDNLETTFPEEWARLGPDERELYAELWRERSHSLAKTLWWFCRQLAALPFLPQPGFFARLIYFGLWIVVPVALVVLALKLRTALTLVLADVRLYAAPAGAIERAIVQRIDRRVMEQFLRLIGLKPDFRPLEPKEQIQLGGQPRRFRRVVWLAHSLGTVVSYNVVSDLFVAAEQFEASGDAEQKAGVQQFREAFVRFVTIGSPLDKIACLAGEKALRPWPASVPLRTDQRGPSDLAALPKGEARRWWVNYFNTLDPVSGSLEQPLICRDHPPVNLHVRWRDSFLGAVPGAAHIAYWGDTGMLTYLLSRVYGSRALPGTRPEPISGAVTFFRLLLGLFVWAALVGGAVLVILATIAHYLFFREISIGRLLSHPWTLGALGTVALLAFASAGVAHLLQRRAA